MQIKMISLCASVVMFFGGGSHAEGGTGTVCSEHPEYYECQLITVGVGEEVPLRQSPSTVTVINRKIIEDYNFSSISSAVETLAGIQVYRTAFKQQVPTVRGVLQDHYANKVLITINGVPTWHATTGESNLDRISIHDVERIEVLKGPASVIYGSQAYTGAINIELRNNTDDSKEFWGGIHTRIGNQGAHSVGAHHYDSSSENGLSVFAAINEERGNRYRYDYTDEEGVNATIDDYIDSLNATALLKYDEHSFLFNAFRIDEGNYEGATQKFSEGAGNNHDVDGFILGYTYDHAWDKNKKDNKDNKDNTILQLFYDFNERDFSRSANDDTRSNVMGYRVGGSLRNNLSISKNFAINFGGDYEQRKSQEYPTYQRSTDTISSDNNLFNRSVYECSGYAQVDWEPAPKWKIVLGSRFTENENAGNNLSSRGTIAYFLNPQNTIKFIAGQSFRTPSLFELYFQTPDGKTAVGNENLKPETADTFELSYQYAKGSFSLQALAYYSIYKEKIHRVNVNNANVYTNGEDFTAKGFEVDLNYSNPNFANVFLNFDYVDGDDGDRQAGTNHYNFFYVPEFTASAGLSYKILDDFNVSIIGNYIGSTNGPVEEIDDSVIFDLNFAYQHKYRSLQLKHVMSIYNVSDTLVTFPEYVRRQGVNEIPFEYERSIFYSLVANF